MQSLYGINSVRAALLARKRTFHSILYNHVQSRRSGLLELADAAKIPCFQKNKQELDKIVKGQPHQGIVLRCTPLQPKELSSLNQLLIKERNIWVYASHLTDPQNLGAVIRTAVFMGATGIIVDSKQSCGLNSTVSKTSAGAVQIAQILQVSKFNTSLFWEISQKFRIYASGHPKYKGKPIIAAQEVRCEENAILILGSQGEGVRPHLQRISHASIQIKGGEQTIGLDSLNVNAALAIMLSRLI